MKKEPKIMSDGIIARVGMIIFSKETGLAKIRKTITNGDTKKKQSARILSSRADGNGWDNSNGHHRTYSKEKSLWHEWLNYIRKATKEECMQYRAIVKANKN